MSIFKGILETQVGPVQILAEDNYIIRLDFVKAGLVECSRFIEKYFPDNRVEDGVTSTVITALVQLDEYFAGTRKLFDLNVKLYGTPFRTKVWSELCKIPYGETISYKELAQRCESEKGFRAVGQANHFNPISIIVPCHRVIGSNTALTGYGGGLDNKKFLLEHEAKYR